VASRDLLSYAIGGKLVCCPPLSCPPSWSGEDRRPQGGGRNSCRRPRRSKGSSRPSTWHLAIARRHDRKGDSRWSVAGGMANDAPR
jgi:hypothetical protein